MSTTHRRGRGRAAQARRLAPRGAAAARVETPLRRFVSEFFSSRLAMVGLWSSRSSC